MRRRDAVTVTLESCRLRSRGGRRTEEEQLDHNTLLNTPRTASHGTKQHRPKKKTEPKPKTPDRKHNAPSTLKRH